MKDASWIRFFLAGWGTPFSAYVALQALGLCTLKQRFRYAVALPLPFMVWVAVATIEAYRHGSNMWPIVMILVSPLAVLYVLVVQVAGWTRQQHPRRRALVVAVFLIVVTACIPYVLMSAQAHTRSGSSAREGFNAPPRPASCGRITLTRHDAGHLD